MWKDVLESAGRLGALDFFDLFIVAFLIYLIIKLLRQTHSISVAFGILTLFGFYGLALLFNLPLTSLVLRPFFGFFLIIVAIIFQRELRRFFSSFAFWGLARQLKPPSHETIDVISRSVGHLANQRIGALVVFPGREPIERHLEGGYSLAGEISEPLLFSIFDKTSPGHDGAVIIGGNQIKKFASHLPLSEQTEKIRNFGLRHRAALGLSERSDAFVIAVSEERGAITVAQNGNFFAVRDENALRRRLLDFHQEKFPRLNLINFLGWLIKNILLLGVSFFIALGLFLVVNSQFILVQRSFVVAPEFKNLPAEYVISDTIPQDIILTLKGRTYDFEKVKQEDLKVFVDLDQIKIKKTGWYKALIDSKNIALPFNFSLVKVDPTSIRIQIGQ